MHSFLFIRQIVLLISCEVMNKLMNMIMGFHITHSKCSQMEKIVKIGILGAMLEEVSSIQEMMIIEKTTVIAGREYSEGKIKDLQVVLVFSRWGKVASASTTTTLINKF